MAKFIRAALIIVIVLNVTGCRPGSFPLHHEKPSKEVREILEQLIGKSSDEVINKLGLPVNHIVLDDQHYLLYQSEAGKYSLIHVGKDPVSTDRRCLKIETDADNLVKEYSFDYIGSAYSCLNYYFSESELEHATFLVDQAKVRIDIRPYSDSNDVDPKSKEDIHVAVLSAMYFDARSVIPSTVAFGPAPATISSYQAWKGVYQAWEDVDVNDDGMEDRIFFFRISETGIACGDKEATLTGRTFQDLQFSGTDSVITVNCN